MNPLFFAYASTANVEAYAKPTAIFVAGRTNRNDDAFQRARDKGAEVYAYFNLVERRNSRVSALDESFYMGDMSKVPLWGNNRAGFQNLTMLTDIRVGSVWIKFAIDYMREVVRSGKFDGFFLDVIGSQLWMSDYKSWPLAEREEWRSGAVEAVRLLDQMRRAEDESFILVNNNHWFKALWAEKYVNGICIEHPNSSNTAFLKPYAGHEYSDLGRRRVLVITRDQTDTADWSNTPGVTHIAAIPGTEYGEPQPALVPYSDLRGPESASLIASLKQRLATAEDQCDELSTMAREANKNLTDAIARVNQLTADNSAQSFRIDQLTGRLAAIADIARVST